MESVLIPLVDVIWSVFSACLNLFELGTDTSIPTNGFFKNARRKSVVVVRVIQPRRDGFIWAHISKVPEKAFFDESERLIRCFLLHLKSAVSATDKAFLMIGKRQCHRCLSRLKRTCVSRLP